MASNVLIKDKHLKLDQVKIEKIKKILKVKTETEAIEKAMDFVLAEEAINQALREVGGKGKLKKGL